MPLNRVTILGVGLLGGSIGLAVRSRSSSCRVVGYGHRRATLDRFWQSIGMWTVKLSPEEHDRHLADISHLPHAVAAALVAMQADAALPLAGKGFLDATRIAGGDGALWRDILHDNADNLRE